MTLAALFWSGNFIVGKAASFIKSHGSHLISRPVVYADRGFGMTPMEQGLKVVGTVEFGGLKNPTSKSRIKNLI